MLLYTITVGMVAGEASGDMLGARLIRALRKLLPDIRFVGVAGLRMQKEGMEVWYKAEEITLIGIIEIIKYIPKILYIRYDLIRRFIQLKPNIFIGIDLPDFNLVIEHSLKKQGIITVHYVSPSVWAWRSNRIFKVRRATNHLLVLFPFEKIFYDRYNISCQFIGHTLADQIPLNPNKLVMRRKLGIAANVHCLALLPGSRNSEIEMLSADFLYCVNLLNRHFPKLEVLVPFVNQRLQKRFCQIQKKITPMLKLRFLGNNQSHQAMIAADAALLASGTATLECMLAKCPMVVGYKINPITFALIKRKIKTPWISLPNLLAGRELVKEFLQTHCEPQNLAQALISLLNNSQKQRIELQNIFRQLHQQIRCNADEQAARAILKLINKQSLIK